MSKTKQKIKKVTYTTEWFNKLVQDLEDILHNAKQHAGYILLKTKWKLGDRILRDYKKFGRLEYGNVTQQTLAFGLGTTQQRISEIIRFRESVGDDFDTWLATFDGKRIMDFNTGEYRPIGKRFTWKNIVREWIPKRQIIAKPTKGNAALEGFIRNAERKDLFNIVSAFSKIDKITENLKQQYPVLKKELTKIEKKVERLRNKLTNLRKGRNITQSSKL